MSLNDPFGRVSRRQREAYRQLREQLRQQGLTTAAAVGQAQRKLRRTGLSLLAVVVGAALIGAILFSQLRALIAVTGVLLLLWLGSSYLQTRNHLNTYARELDAAESDRAVHNSGLSTQEDEKP